MAISFIGSAENSAIDGGGVTLTLPAMQQNDLVIVALGVGDNDGTAASADMTTGGYTEVADLFSNDTHDSYLGVFWKVMGATPDSTAVTAAFGGGDAAHAAVAMVFRGVDTTTPMDVTPTTATGINTHSPSPPAINHNNPSGVWTVMAVANAHILGGAGTYTFPSGYTTNAIDRGSNDSTDTTVGMGYNTAPADPETPGFTLHSGTASTSNSWCACTIALRPAATGVTVTPGVASLVTTKFAPTVLTPRLVTPPIISLVTSLFAPGVTVGVRVTPSTASLVTSLFAPTVLTPRLVTPATASLITARFAPSVIADTKVTPGVAALVTSTFAPTVLTPRLVTPGTLALVTSLLAPTVSTPRLVTPGTAALTTAQFAPAVLTPRLVTPGTLSLVTTLFSPTVTAGGGVVVTPSTAALITTLFAPSVLAPRLVTPPTAVLTTSLFAPSVLTPRLVIPGTASLVTSLFSPTITTPRLVTPGTLVLITTRFAPTVTAGAEAAVRARLWFDYWKQRPLGKRFSWPE